MRRRYLLLFGEPGAQRGRAEQSAVALGLALQMSSVTMTVLVSPSCPCLRIGAEGVALGMLFRRHDRARGLDRFDPEEAQALLADGIDRLLRLFWGGYVAALPRGDGILVLRDPSGALPCYWARGKGVVGFASDAELLVDCGLASPEVDWSALGRHFFRAGVPAPETGLRDIRELLPGFRMLAAGTEQHAVWSPWDHVRPLLEGGEERLRRAIMQAVEGWGASHDRVLASLSGGLDSSIVAAALRPSSTETIGLTLYGDDPNSDERAYARALAAHLGFRLIERPYRLTNIDIVEPLAPHLPRPLGRTQALAYERAHRDVAEEVGADAFMTGNGGDSVFGYSQSAAPIADRFLEEGWGGGIVQTLRDVCGQTGCSAVQAAAAARRIVRGPRGYRCRPNPLLLAPDLLATLGPRDLDHPWLHAPERALPGKAAHIAAILRVQQSMEPGRSSLLPVLNPLMAQPVLETCLAIPSWAWRKGARDRAVARDAFASRLPKIVAERRSKGGPDAFAAHLLRHFRSRICERLLDGRLAAHRILDRCALERVLGDERPTPGDERVRILELVAAEAWLDAWTSRRVVR